MKQKHNNPLLVTLAAILIGTLLMFYLVSQQATPTEVAVRAYAKEMGISYREYPKSLIDLLERNPETESFVLGYPFREEQAIDMNTFDRSQGVPLMMQWDTRWGYMKYGSDFAALTGCGPVCLAMAGWYLTGDPQFSPNQMLTFAAENGYYSSGNGSKWTLISEGGPALGLRVKELPLVEKKITDYLKAGEIIIAVMGPGDFTTSGHYIVLTGLKDGQLCINDPNSKVNSQKTWPYETFAAQVRNLWLIQAEDHTA